MKLRLLAALPIMLASLTACIPTTEQAEAGATPPELSGPCDASKLDYAVGKELTPDLEARLKAEAKAEVVRAANENGAITMDYNPSRLNIFTNDAGKIVRINCG